MSLFKKNDNLLDDAVAQVANEPIDPQHVEDAASRVWARLSQGAVAEAPAPVMAEATAPAAGGLHGCEDFQALIPAYLRGELSPARALLVEDHTRSCVPCRRALREAREGKGAAERRPAVRKDHRKMWMAAAAVLAVVLGFGVVTLIQEMLAGGANMASVEAVEGTLYRVAGDSSKPLGAGETLDEGEVVRTAKGSTALLRMADGSTIEMAERASFALDAGRKGNTIELERGKVIVHASKQRNRHLFVATRDALVSVRGTIFAVNSGIKGSRVSVVEGEVRVEQAKKDAILHPGDQVTTHTSVERVPVKSEIAWSRDARQYEQLLAELTALGKEIDARVDRPGLRYSTRLLDLAPAGTTIWIGLPNLSQSLSQTQTILDEKIAESPSLAKWWTDTLRSSGNERKFREMIEKIGDLGRNLGDEIAVAIKADDDENGEDGMVLLAEVTNEAAFRATLEAEIAEINSRESRHSLVIVDDLATAPANDDAMYLWIGDGLFVASPSVDQIRAVAAGGSGFAATSFRAKIAQQYNDGSGWLFAADLHTLIEKGQAEESDEDRQAAERLGILDVEHFIVDRREIDGRAETRAALTFSQQRRGVAAWVAAPAPMGSIGFYSPETNLAAAFVVKSPVAIVDELLNLNPEFAQELEKIQTETGLDLRNDLAAPMGGEVAIGVDGPVLPSPSWKLVAEVYDPARLQQTFQKIVDRANAELRKNGKGESLRIVTTESGGRTFYSIRFQEGKLIELNYVFEDGYMVAAPSRALLERAIQLRESGVTLATHAKFRDLLGPDGQVNVSALVYQNLAPLAKSAGKILPDSVKKGGQAGPDIARILATQGPTLYYAYAEPDRIVFAGSNQNPLGLNLGTLAGAGGLLGMMNEAHGQAHGRQEAR